MANRECADCRKLQYAGNNCYCVVLIMNRKLTRETCIFALQCWWKTKNNSDKVVQLFVDKFSQTSAPFRQSIYNLNKWFQATRSIHDLLRSETPKTTTSDKNITAIAKLVIQSPKKSVRRRCAEFDIQSSSLHCILKSLKLKLYHPQLQGWTEGDFDRQVEFSD